MSAGGRVLVVGAGIAGLATALRLRRSGWDVVVVERAAGLRGGGHVLHPVAGRRRRQGRRLRNLFISPNTISPQARLQLIRLPNSRVTSGLARQILGVPKTGTEKR
ncbi:2-polyprenyl-6-methoxyphenol hydroxylase-like FAD-dependent oxidoreductase [Lipingzhangella halophila]|uniref:2-polyprenyl-6-methoxyphenol hydroxylase-like FAD-dependent oxidoreductase n=1 Tax=Lipingzhangella halophila TaxID=1783352 RepID=A0A7W7RF69_9ACTN|nr:FAD-dependent oxidoreductase [Lipingzhangella halophila]MBB4930872.1 2-polyprenyl-6-methoxyphenol hydroxylase-like FAD-dependent oxidoreductase [Lipingzhangella halophila]